MKHLQNYLSKRFLILIAALFFTIVTSNSSHATINPPVLTEISLASATSVGALSADMIECPSLSGQLQAVAWSDLVSGVSSCYVNITYSGGGSLTIPIGSSTNNPNVVLADDPNTPGTDYSVCVMYRDNSSLPNSIIKMDYYTLTGIGTLSFGYTYNSTQTISVNTSTISQEPRIDVFTDNTTLVAGLPSVHKLAFTWAERNGSNFDLYANTCDITTSGIVYNSPFMYVASNNATAADVACYTDITATPTDYALITYYDGTSNIELIQWDLGTTTTSVATPGSGAPLPQALRIEAMSLYNSGSGKAMYDVVYAILVSGLYVTYEYNDLTGTAADLSSAAFSAYDNVDICVAAGVGPTGAAGGIGNSQYTVPWYCVDAGATIYAQAVDAGTGGLVLSSGDYNQVNMNPIPFGFGPNRRSRAAASCSNSGNNMLTAWFDGTDIVYKATTNTFAYKTTSVSNQQIADKSISIYPNPAQNSITITGAGKGTLYNITDVAGRKVLDGSSEKIDISNLQRGVYFIHINTTVLKFVKG